MSCMAVTQSWLPISKELSILPKVRKQKSVSNQGYYDYYHTGILLLSQYMCHFFNTGTKILGSTIKNVM